MRFAMFKVIRPYLPRSMPCLARLSRRFGYLLALLISMSPVTNHASDFDKRFTLNHTSYSFEVGLGQTADIPKCSNCPLPRRSHQFFSLITSYERNLTGITGEQSSWHGALFWRMEGGVAVITDDLEAVSYTHLTLPTKA